MPQDSESSIASLLRDSTVPGKSTSLIEDVRWVHDNLHVKKTGHLSKTPPSKAAVKLLLDAQKDPATFRNRFIIPILRKEAKTEEGAEARRHDRNLTTTLENCIRIARDAVRDARSSGEACQSVVPRGIAEVGRRRS